MKLSVAMGGLAAIFLATPAVAQFNNQWVSFTEDNSKLNAGTISSSNNETDLATDDTNQDGWLDVAVVRKQPFTSTGKRTNIMLMNENGVLTDRTSEYASSSDVGGDNGFLTDTNDRDVVFVDVTGDGWTEMVTVVTLSQGFPKHISHPRIYRNLGDQGSSWQGFLHEDARMPQLFIFGSGSIAYPRFCSVGFGDMTGDGAADLFFGDYDAAGGADLNDRFLVNDGAGFFADQSQMRMSSSMLQSAFSMAHETIDMNGDGLNDVLKDTALFAPQDIRVIYNNPNNVGFFQIQDKFHTNAPYHVDGGDLNNDGRPDMVSSDDNDDRYRYNLGNDSLGMVNWGSSKTFQFLSSGDDGFGSNCLIVDLDNDGWPDSIHTDIDVDISGYSRRMHIYHNPGGSPGQQITLKEERQSSGGSEGPGWLGAVGLMNSDLEGTHDFVASDFDNDGDRDLIISRYNGTEYYTNDLNPEPCATPVNYGAADTSSIGNVASIGSSGGDPSVSNPNFTITLEGGNPNQGSILVESLSQDSVTTPWGTLLVGTFIRHPSFTSATGTDSYVVPMSAALAGATVYYQWVVRDPGTGAIAHHSEGLAVTFCN